MRRKCSLLFVLLVSILALTACGNSKKYYEGHKYLNFKETLTAEEMEIENKDYAENDEQAIIYLFRGQGCGYCRKFLTFLNSISKEYGKYFKVISFEVWYDKDNSELMGKLPKVTEVDANGVPYIIIGDRVFNGYSEQYDDDIKAKIMQQYKDGSYDVFNELAKKEKEFTGFSNTAVIIINFFVVLVGVVIVICISNKNKQEIIEAINNNTKTYQKENDENKKVKKRLE